MTQDIVDKTEQSTTDDEASWSSCSRRWTPAEIESLRDMAQAQVPKHEIAVMLDRSTNSLEIQARKLGIRFVRIRKTQWLATKQC